MQPAADVFKLFTKENVSPGRSDLWVFLGAPIAMFLPAALVWLVIPFAPDAVIANLNVGILFFVAVTSIGALGVVMAGYGSRSTFSLLGALRGAAQMISYEVPLILSLLGVVMLAGSLSFVDVVLAQGDTFWTWYFLPLFPHVHRLLRLRDRRGQEGAVRPAGGGERDRRRVHDRVLGDDVGAHPGR